MVNSPCSCHYLILFKIKANTSIHVCQNWINALYILDLYNINLNSVMSL